MMPPIMAGIVAIYGLVISVLIANRLQEKSALHTNFLFLGAGLSVGICGMVAGFSIGIVGDVGVRGATQQPKLYVGMILIMVFAEVLGMLSSWESLSFFADYCRSIWHGYWDNDVESVGNKCNKVLLISKPHRVYLK